MSSSDFRHLLIKGEPGKPDRLFRAAASAFCSLTRPSRREVEQLEDLALPLFDAVSVEAKRYVAAALSECEYPPAGLVRRLADETVDIAAPLLIRARSLKDVDLIGLIGRHGLPHARAIARRHHLNPTIAALIRALVASTVPPRPPDGSPESATPVWLNPPSNDAAPASADEAERVRRRLRSFMRPALPETAPPRRAAPRVIDRDDYARLLDAALSPTPIHLQSALVDFVGIGSTEALALLARGGVADLLIAWKALALSEEQAFLLTAALRPAAFDGIHTIRDFLDAYRGLGAAAVRDGLPDLGRRPDARPDAAPR